MTKQEILDALEGLKDYVNDHGKRQIDALKGGIMGLEEPLDLEPSSAEFEKEDSFEDDLELASPVKKSHAKEPAVKKGSRSKR